MFFEIKMTIGQTDVVIREEVQDHKELLEKLAFFDSIPRTGVNGGKNLRVVYRSPKGYDYYSILDLDTNQEFCFGQSKDKPGSLFAKDWKPAYSTDNSDAGQDQNFMPQQSQQTSPRMQQHAQQDHKPVQQNYQRAQQVAPQQQNYQPTPPPSDANQAIQDVMAKYGIRR